MNLSGTRKIACAAAALWIATAAITVATTTFYIQSGSSSPYNNVLEGLTLSDHANGNDYSGFVGELVMIPTDQTLLSSLPNPTTGVVTIPNSGPFANLIGLVAFCIDSETTLGISGDLTVDYDFVSHNNPAAEDRYINDPVANYLSGGLLRAAYLMETFYDQITTDVGGAAMQAAIWEVIYDENPNLSLNQGNYYIRTDVGDAAAQATAAQVRDLGNSWFAAAEADVWGGPDYDPGDKVIFWLDPANTNNNQSLITLNPAEFTVSIPEPSTSLMFVLTSAACMVRRTRRTH